MNKKKSFQNIIMNLQTYWMDQGCVLMQPYDSEVGAGTFHPATVLRVLGQIQFGKLRIFNRVADQLMEDMEKIQIGYNIITNFKLLFNHLQIIYKTFTWKV